jgi:molybdopterin synthase catalytic subunit
MKIFVHLTAEPLDIPAERANPAAEGSGAAVEFCGVVRGQEHGRKIAALEYEAYQPMAEREIKRLLAELANEFPCESVRVIHRIGRVPVGEASIFVHVSAGHRAEAFGMASRFMDRLKQDVPIWKVRAIES